MTHPSNRVPLGSQKLQPHHLERLAVVYVRQSTLQQVSHHQESTRLQYDLVHQAEALGWRAERILVIDEDQGKSGATAEGRSGFQRLVSEVSLNHVGLILGIEMSRLARSSKDWHQLLEVCALFRTLIADLDGVYDPMHYNDRLLLGLKGTMSEAELHILKQRMLAGTLNKAKRGELAFDPPIGYLRRPSGEIVLDPDEQVQQVVRLIFRKFQEIGTLNGLLRYLVRQQIQVGVRVRIGRNRGDLEWRQPNRMTLQNLLKNPAYAGAYAYGRRQVDPRRKQPGKPSTGRVISAPEDWHAFIKDRLPAYISWEQYQQNLAQLQANQARADAIGAARHGEALLSGLLVCQFCGCRMTVHYSGRGKTHEYVCTRLLSDYAGPRCQQVPGQTLNPFVTQRVLAALHPAALELSLQAAAHLEQERQELDTLWNQRLERAAMEAERAARHYRLIEPENRLVARQLAQDWEDKLAHQQRLQEDYQRFCAQQPRHLSASERTAIATLAQDIPQLWEAPTTTQAQRKDIIRQLIQRIHVQVQGQSEKVDLAIEWTGGVVTHHQVIRPIVRWEHLSFYPQLCERIRTLAAEGHQAAAIATQLNQEAFHSPKSNTPFKSVTVLELMRRLGLYQRRPKGVNTEVLAEHEWWLPDLAQTLEMPSSTLYTWVKQNQLRYRKQATSPYRLIIWADEADIQRLRQRQQVPYHDRMRQQWLTHENNSSPSNDCSPIPSSGE
ncbi:recombinase family protein [Sphaerothrix gracilis]|uniref:recombinase family protein n=1 Tax=Sphaerothrix gracilis TaxID=3151835 RepID=UPI0031FE1A9D